MCLASFLVYLRYGNTNNVLCIYKKIQTKIKVVFLVHGAYAFSHGSQAICYTYDESTDTLMFDRVVCSLFCELSRHFLKKQ